MSTSRIGAVLDALYSVATATYAADDTMVVYDGPQGSTSAYAKRCLFVGGDGGADLDEPTKATQEWAHANHTAKDEIGSVDNVLYSQDGTTEIPRLRTEGSQLIALLEDAIRGDPTLGDVVLYSDISEVVLDQQQTERGALARFIFTVRYKARI